MRDEIPPELRIDKLMADDALDSGLDDDAEGGEAGEGEDGAPKKGKRKLIIIAAAALVLVLGGGAAAYFLLFSGGGDEPGEVAIAAIETFFYDLPEITVNLASTGEEEEFLKLAVSLELKDQAMADAVAPRLTLVMDAFQVYLRELRRSDLQGSAGIYRLKDELRRRVNLAVYPARVESILFKEILVQ